MRVQEEPDYEADLAIDCQALDVEWLEQPNRFFKYCQLLAQARKALDEEVQRQDVLYAKHDAAIREGLPETVREFGPFPEKLTETAIKSAIERHKSSQEQRTAVINTKYRVELLVGAVRAMDQRKQGLENEIKLLSMQYYSGPQEPRDLPAEVKYRTDKDRRARERVGKRLNQKD